jgi:hypothetical protein
MALMVASRGGGGGQKGQSIDGVPQKAHANKGCDRVSDVPALYHSGPTIPAPIWKITGRAGRVSFPAPKRSMEETAVGHSFVR